MAICSTRPKISPRCSGKIDEGFDIASGWRKERVDNPLTRKIPSRIANWLMSKASGVDLRDFGTTFKAYRVRSPERRSSLRRTAPLYPGAGQFLRRARGGSADPEHAARFRRFALRAEPDLPRPVRYSDHPVPAEILHPADAFLRRDRPDRDGSRQSACSVIACSSSCSGGSTSSRSTAPC